MLLRDAGRHVGKKELSKQEKAAGSEKRCFVWISKIF
jgi:hypothetical protein